MADLAERVELRDAGQDGARLLVRGALLGEEVDLVRRVQEVVAGFRALLLDLAVEKRILRKSNSLKYGEILTQEKIF